MENMEGVYYPEVPGPSSRSDPVSLTSSVPRDSVTQEQATRYSDRLERKRAHLWASMRATKIRKQMQSWIDSGCTQPFVYDLAAERDIAENVEKELVDYLIYSPDLEGMDNDIGEAPGVVQLFRPVSRATLTSALSQLRAGGCHDADLCKAYCLKNEEDGTGCGNLFLFSAPQETGTKWNKSDGLMFHFRCSDRCRQPGTSGPDWKEENATLCPSFSQRGSAGNHWICRLPWPCSKATFVWCFDYLNVIKKVPEHEIRLLICVQSEEGGCGNPFLVGCPPEPEVPFLCLGCQLTRNDKSDSDPDTD